MKKYTHRIILAFCLVAVILILCFALWMNRSVERYGVLRRFSTSGEARFNYYDIKEGKVLESWEGHPWFFALVSEDKTDSYVRYIQENKDSVFKITGKREKEDCDYYGNGICLEDISIKRIEVVAK